MRQTRAVLALLVSFGATFVAASWPWNQDTFTNHPEWAVSNSAPAWHMDSKTCFPTDAMSSWMVQNPGLDPGWNHCNAGKLSEGCPKLPEQNGQHTESTPFPTYWSVRKCADNSWRVLYDVYFEKDTGHRHDWEWTVVKWELGQGEDPNSSDAQYWRAGIWLEQDGKHVWWAWNDLPDTYDDDGDIDDYGERDKNHPKLYFAKFSHAVLPYINTDVFSESCLSNYASDDYRYEASKWLVTADTLPKDWDFGTANSKPSAFDEGGVYDMCNL